MLRPLLLIPLLLIACARPGVAVVPTAPPEPTTELVPTARPTAAVQVRATAAAAAATANAALPTRPPTATPLPTAVPTGAALVYLGLSGSTMVPITSTQSICDELSTDSDSERDARISELLTRGDVNVAPLNTSARLRSVGQNCAQVEVIDGPLESRTVWAPNSAVQPSRIAAQPVAPVLTAVPARVIAQAVSAVRPFSASLTGGEGVRFNLYCLRIQPDGSTSSQSWRGTVPASYAIGEALTVTCSAQKQISRTLTLSMRITSGDTVVGNSETTTPYGVVEVSTAPRP